MIKDYFVFRNVLIENINQSGLDPGVALFILKDVAHQLEQTCNQQVQKELAKEASQSSAENNVGGDTP